MFTVSRWTRVLLVVALWVVPQAQAQALTSDDLLELQDMVAQVPQACPKAWENLNQDIDYTPWSDVWQNDLADKAAYIRYAATYLVDEAGTFIIDNYSDPQEIITVCAGVRMRVLELLGLDAAAMQNASTQDSDSDGVSDLVDQCASTVAGESVNVIGCAYSQLDDDADGVQNGNDLCAGTLTGEPVNTDGCALSLFDTDNDGVNDLLDQCATTDPAHTVNAVGCALELLDSDNDDVNDAFDPYPLQASTQCPAQ